MHDVVLRDGTVYDGRGGPPFVADVALAGERIAAIGDPGTLTGRRVIDVAGLAVAPGFINMLSWSTESLIMDGKSQSEIRQGVTLQVMGEGTSMGPLSPAMKQARKHAILSEEEAAYEIEWTTLGEYLEFLERRGVACNVASFVGSSTLRVYAMGYDDRPPAPAELALMQSLIRQAMAEGAMGLSAALIYSPAGYAQTDELVALARVVAEYDGVYISHIRGEGATLLEALDEFMHIVREAGVRGEIYHLKAAGRAHHGKMPEAIRRISAARAAGLPITADMYTYAASGTGLDSCLPPWAHEGGHEALMARLRDPQTRERLKAAMRVPSREWENMYAENTPDQIMLAGFKNPALKPYTGQRLSQVAAQRGTPPEETLLDLILEDDSRVFTIYFSMSEDNLRLQIQQPWVSFCSDAGSIAPEEPFTLYHPHPRAYGSFARVLGRYVREEKLLSLAEAVRRLTTLPADVLKIAQRGALKPGYFADVVVFDPARVQDYATFEQPHQYATGMVHVFVNGGHVLRDGEHTGALPGRVVRGPGYRGQG